MGLLIRGLESMLTTVGSMAAGSSRELTYWDTSTGREKHWEQHQPSEISKHIPRVTPPPAGSHFLVLPKKFNHLGSIRAYVAIPTQTTGVTPCKKEASLMKVESFINLWVQRHVLASSLVLWLLSRLTVLGSFLGTTASPGRVLGLINGTRHDFHLMEWADFLPSFCWICLLCLCSGFLFLYRYPWFILLLPLCFRVLKFMGFWKYLSFSLDWGI